MRPQSACDSLRLLMLQAGTAVDPMSHVRSDLFADSTRTVELSWPPLLSQEHDMEKRKVNVLLVEDDEVDIMNVQRAFSRGQIDNPLYIANNGLDALDMLRGTDSTVVPGHRRLVLLDINMPKMNGLEFLQALRQDEALKSTPVVVLTTSDADQDRLEAYRLNVAGYILKPVAFATFAEVMAALNQYWALCEIP
jgi:CheY-like chemotaxis protein